MTVHDRSFAPHVARAWSGGELRLRTWYAASAASCVGREPIRRLAYVWPGPRPMGLFIRAKGSAWSVQPTPVEALSSQLAAAMMIWIVTRPRYRRLIQRLV